MVHTKHPILVLGIGNILLRDVGVGVHVIKQLQERSLPDSVEVIDGGTAGADLLDIVADREKVIVIDAVHTNCKPGTILRFTPDELVPDEQAHISLHQFGIIETLQMAKQLGCAPKNVVFLGITPADISAGLELCEQLAKSIPDVIELIMNEL